MSTMLEHELEQLGRTLKGWSARLRLLWCVTALLAAVLLLGLVDFAFQIGGTGRWLSFSILAALLAAAAALLAVTLRRRYTPESLAAMVEHAFPELDNHLINHLQFARNPDHPFKAAYVASGPPAVQELDIEQRMKNRRAHRNGILAVSAAALLLLLPSFFWGTSWATAIWRVINPLSSVAPATLTRIIAVEPGDADIRQGTPLVLLCRVEGARGHAVRVEIDPDDARQTRFDLGQLTGEPGESFAHRLAQVNAGLRYRFLAGDAPASDWYRITPRPPPAFTGWTIEVTPPPYTGRPAAAFRRDDGKTVQWPAGSTVKLAITCNAPLERLQLHAPGLDQPVALTAQPGHLVWKGQTSLSQSGILRMEGEDHIGHQIAESINCTVDEDKPPVIEIVSPTGPAVLPHGSPPLIEFRVRDDHGLASVHIEQVFTAGNSGETTTALEQWTKIPRPDLHQIWRGAPVLRATSLTFRVVATDITPGEPQITRSSSIEFNTPTLDELAGTRDQMERDSVAKLQQVIELQKKNAEQSRALQKRPDADPADWTACAERQRDIRGLTRDLLVNPIRPLGKRTDAIAKVYANEMALAVNALNLAADSGPDRQPARASEAVNLQDVILRVLTGTEDAAAKSMLERRLNGIAAMLAALVERQGDIIKQTGRHADAATAVAAALVNRQDDLSRDVLEFRNACGKEADAVTAGDPGFAEILQGIVQAIGERRIREDMLLAAERLEAQKATEALVPGTRAHTNLQALEKMLDQIRVDRREEELTAMHEGLDSARATIERMRKIHEEIRETMDTLRGHGDKDTELFDTLFEEFSEVAAKNKESLLMIPTDLHIFSDLNAANELVEDIFSIFQEVIQKEGTAEMTPDQVVDFVEEKNEQFILEMAEMKDRIDEMEKWMGDSPDMLRVITETIDREEMPESGIAPAALAAELEALIGDLLEQAEDTERAGDDGATSFGIGDMETGHETSEGDIATFSARGEMGNQRPDHKEQDGRSKIGREGMSAGETAAGGGTFGEGDENIEARRTEDPTQSGMVQAGGEAQTKATGGGKLASGKADDVGMTGGVKRMDSTEQGSREGMESLLARTAEDIYAKASLQNIRVDSLKTAAHHLRQADDAVAQGDIARLQEHRQSALAQMRDARIRIEAGPSDVMDAQAPTPILRDVIQSGPDLAPPQFQTQVAEYFKLLNETF